MYLQRYKFDCSSHADRGGKLTLLSGSVFEIKSTPRFCPSPWGEKYWGGGDLKWPSDCDCFGRKRACLNKYRNALKLSTVSPVQSLPTFSPLLQPFLSANQFFWWLLVCRMELYMGKIYSLIHPSLSFVAEVCYDFTELGDLIALIKSILIKFPFQTIIQKLSHQFENYFHQASLNIALLTLI